MEYHQVVVTAPGSAVVSDEAQGKLLKKTPLTFTVSLSLSTETPQKDGEDALSSSDSATDQASSLFKHWGHDLGPESRRVALKKFRYHGYNSYFSDRISLTRPIPDLRPDGSVHQSMCPLLINSTNEINDGGICLCRSSQTNLWLLPPPGAETCRIHQIFRSSVSSSSLSMRPCQYCCAPSTQPFRGRRPTCSKRSYWWMITAAAVRNFP